MRLRPALVLLVCLAGVGTARGQAEGEITHPVVVHQVDAEYPQSMAPQHADVILLVTLDAEGNVTDVKIATSGGAAFDAAAVEAVRKWTFSPATRNGKPFRARIKIPFHFAPPVAAPPPTAKATAAPPSPPPPAKPPPVAPVKPGEIEEVHVIGRAKPPSVGVSDVHFHVGDLRVVHQSPNTTASSILESASPMVMTNESGVGHAEQIFLRGFDAGEGEDIEFSVDGVPINESGNLHGNGYADTHFIIPELVQAVRIVEGPFDPRQGNYAVAASADFDLGLPMRGVMASYTGGAWNTQRGLVLFGPKGTSERTFVGADVYSTDGYGQNRDALQAAAMAQYEGKIGERGLYHLTAQAYATRFHTSGLVREDDFEAGRIGFYDSYDRIGAGLDAVPQGGDVSRYSVAGDIEDRVGSTILRQQVFLIQRDLRLLENFTGYTVDRRGDEIDTHMSEQTFGARGFARFRARLLHQRQELEVGYYARGDETHGTLQRLAAATGQPYTTDIDLQSSLGDIGVYADADLRAARWINLRGGIRSDLFTYDVLDQLTNRRTTAAAFAPMPRATLVLGPFEGFSFSGSIGTGLRAVDPEYVSKGPATLYGNILSYEGGVSFARDVARRTRLTARSVFFSTHVNQDLLFSEIEGRDILGSATTRTGWEGGARLRSEHVFGSAVSFDESTNLSLVSAKFDGTGLPVPYVPPVVLRSDTAVNGNLPLRIQGRKVAASLGVGVTYAGHRPLPVGGIGDEIFTLDATLSFTWRWLQLGVTGTNLTNNQYRLGEYDYVSNFHTQPQASLTPVRMFSAAPPLGVFGTLAVHFGGDNP
jgi:iron complex outermembrane receptor protein